MEPAGTTARAAAGDAQPHPARVGAAPVATAAVPTAPLAEPVIQELKALTTRYPVKRGALLLMLNRVQEERGWIAPADMRLCGELVGISAAEVYSVVTFYTMYRTRPGARFPIGVCRNIACWVSGAGQLTANLAAKLRVAPGETTPDGTFSLQEVECLGSCGSGPCLEIESRYFENMDGERTARLIERLAAATGDPKQAIDAAENEFRGGGRV
jgi:NADH-quinone oxidoreductase E subunit